MVIYIFDIRNIQFFSDRQVMMQSFANIESLIRSSNNSNTIVEDSSMVKPIYGPSRTMISALASLEDQEVKPSKVSTSTTTGKYIHLL